MKDKEEKRNRKVNRVRLEVNDAQKKVALDSEKATSSTWIRERFHDDADRRRDPLSKKRDKN